MARRLLAFSAVLLHATLTSGITVSPDLPEGLYAISLNSTADPVRIESRASHLYRRQANWKAKCGTRGRININDFTVAKENLQKACDGGETYQVQTAVLYTTGSAVAYFCNYNRPNRCSRAEYEAALLSLVQQCGIGNGGEVTSEPWSKGYGGDNVGVEICI
ncbi:uncharacterized protein DNG_09065 [Cephalotrichum gorgonifer]|uniref:Uncharacterized protein n=1 Tax=Cephalotrichum gorgonifer TaxID=2041049 RepID=A0AAE8SYY1_9PEZI|nr:uncharacterized protein DNG_09065 [Cephalotrichum gorgonifer]